MKAIYIVFTLALLWGFSDGAKRALEALDDFSFQTFLKLFRKDLLDDVGRQWNVTIAQTLVLHQQMAVCHGKIQARVDECKNCTTKLCKVQPLFRHYLDIPDPSVAIQKPLEQVGAGLNEVVDLLGVQSFGFLDVIKDITEETGAVLGSGFESGYNQLKDDFSKLPDIAATGGQFTLDKFNDLGSLTIDGFNNLGGLIGDGLTDLGNSIYHGITDVFGRRRRAIDDATRTCMNRCDNVCWEFLTDDNDYVITNICGAIIVNLNKTVHHNIDRVMSLYNATLDTTQPILTKVEIDRSTLDASTLSINTVYITVNMRGTELRYQSSIPFSFMDMPSTAMGMVREFTHMWK